MTTFTLDGNSNDTNLVISSNYGSITDGNELDVTANTSAIATNATAIATNTTAIATNTSAIATNTSAIATNATAIATNVTAILDISNVKVPALENKDKDLGKKDLEILTGLNSFFRYYSKDLDLSAGVLTSTDVYPPDLNNRDNNVGNISLKQVTPSGVKTVEITKEDYYKLDTYATCKLNLDLINVAGVNTFNSAFTYGYNELFANDPSNIPNFNSNAGAMANVMGLPVRQNLVNAMGSQANCNGQMLMNAGWLLSSQSGIPFSIKHPDSGETINVLAPYMSAGGVDLSGSLLNDDGESPPIIFGLSFEKIDELGKTWADNFLSWCGDISLSKLSNQAFLKAKVKMLLSMQKIYKIERAKQYGISKLTTDYVCELLTKTKDNIDALDVSGGFEYSQFPDLNYMNGVFKDIIESAFDLDPSMSITTIGSVIPAGFSMPPTFITLDPSLNPMGDLRIPPNNSMPHNSMPINPFGAMMKIYYFHAMSILVMCQDKVVDPSFVEAMKNITIVNWDNSGVPHDVSAGLDLTPIDKLPNILANVPVFQDLWFKLNNTYVLTDGINLGSSSVNLMSTPTGQSLINMYAQLYQNLVDNSLNPTSSPLYNLSEFWSKTFMTEFLSTLAFASASYRIKDPNESGGAFCAPILTDDQIKDLLKSTDKINYKLLSEYVNRSNNTNYKFIGTFGHSTKPGFGIKGNLAAFEAASLNEEVSLPSSTACPCG
jgi:hypothetical protein